jgi:NAD-dependent DNA ligase
VLESPQMLEKNVDKECMDVVDDNINMIVPWYLMAAYAYYVQDDPIISDACFDNLAKKGIANWDKIEHRHKDYITIDTLRSGTYLGEYPSRVEGAVNSMRKIYNGK